VAFCLTAVFRRQRLARSLNVSFIFVGTVLHLSFVILNMFMLRLDNLRETAVCLVIG